MLTNNFKQALSSASAAQLYHLSTSELVDNGFELYASQGLGAHGLANVNDWLAVVASSQVAFPRPNNMRSLLKVYRSGVPDAPFIDVQGRAFFLKKWVRDVKNPDVGLVYHDPRLWSPITEALGMPVRSGLVLDPRAHALTDNGQLNANDLMVLLHNPFSQRPLGSGSITNLEGRIRHLAAYNSSGKTAWMGTAMTNGRFLCRRKVDSATGIAGSMAAFSNLHWALRVAVVEVIKHLFAGKSHELNVDSDRVILDCTSISKGTKKPFGGSLERAAIIAKEPCAAYFIASYAPPKENNSLGYSKSLIDKGRDALRSLASLQSWFSDREEYNKLLFALNRWPTSVSEPFRAFNKYTLWAVLIAVQIKENNSMLIAPWPSDLVDCLYMPNAISSTKPICSRRGKTYLGGSAIAALLS